MADGQLFPSMALSFEERFLKDHAGQIMTEPRVAIIELIANSYDAGSTRVEIAWPEKIGEEVSVLDDGVGMTKAELEHRWTTLSYDRLREQGEEVAFPDGVKVGRRSAFGRNGKGRFAAFCFADEYRVVTWRDGKSVSAKVERARSPGAPFQFNLEIEGVRAGHGTRIASRLERGLLPAENLYQIVGEAFSVDPSFEVHVNGRLVQLLDLTGLKTTSIEVGEFGNAKVHLVDALDQGRTTRLRGITWWVKGRMVGEPSWDRLDSEGAYLDGRTDEAKRFSFVVEADFLKKNVKADWTDFHASAPVNAAREAVHSHVLQTLHRLMAATRKGEKKSALARSKELLKPLTIVSKRVIGEFVDQVQESCPSLSPRDLSRTVEVLAKLELSRSGYDLLKQLSACSPDDLDTWNQLMEKWSATSAEIVLNELERRLALVERLQQLVESAQADELHDLQPLFERGLWVFGPEYEAVEFQSNHSLAEVIRTLLGGTGKEVPRKRPDFVALPDRSIGVYSADQFGTDGGISGIRKVLIVELKRGGFRVGQKEADQARDYAKELRKGARVQRDTAILAYVLGATLEEDLESSTVGETHGIQVVPMTYQVLLRRAHDRTFNLQKRIEASKKTLASDGEMQEVLSEERQLDAFVGTKTKDRVTERGGGDGRGGGTPG